jgi:hypothetical protein
MKRRTAQSGNLIIGGVDRSKPYIQTFLFRCASGEVCTPPVSDCGLRVFLSAACEVVSVMHPKSYNRKLLSALFARSIASPSR